MVLGLGGLRGNYCVIEVVQINLIVALFAETNV